MADVTRVDAAFGIVQGEGVIHLTEFDSALGRIAVAERKRRVLAIGFRGRGGLRTEHPEIWTLGDVIEEGEGPSAKVLRRYLEGAVPSFRIPVDLSLTRGSFDRIVLERLHRVRTGRTVTYGELAAMVGNPDAARAVGGAMRRNPIPIVVPCHRVLPSGGGVGNYTGGVEKKIWLLAREGIRFEE